MASERLPWDLVEEILYWLPPNVLVRFSTVSTRWNTLFKDKRFANNHLARARTPQFILFSESKSCSVEVILNDAHVPMIRVHKLPFFIHCFSLSNILNVDYCDGLSLCDYAIHGIAVCNPLLKEINWDFSDVGLYVKSGFNGIGYNATKPDKQYKIFVSNHCSDFITLTALISDVGSEEWKLYKFESKNWRLVSTHGLSLNGTLYWVARYDDSGEYFIQSFEFSNEKFKPFCVLPSKNKHSYIGRSISVYRENRFSLLEQCYSKMNIEIWVTKRKITNEEDVEWMKFMNVKVPNRPNLISPWSGKPPSYFIDDKSHSLVLCSWNLGRQAYIYVAKGNKVYDFKIESVVGFLPYHRTYFPSLL